MNNQCLLKTSLKVCLTLLAFTLSMQSSMAAEFCIGSGADQITGNQNGYRHELWNQNSQGTACMDLGTTGAAFSGRWSGIQNYLARRGLGYDQTKKHHEIGPLNASYDVTYSPNCSAGNSYMGIYGWTYDSSQSSPNDLVEYYIVENWCNWNPSMDANAQNMGSIFGGEYDVIKVKRTNAPSIKGTRDFMQYFSIRKNVRTKGLMNISEHFYHWEKLGMKMGNMHEVSMLVEGYQNSGTANFSSLDVYKSSGQYAKKIYFDVKSHALKVGDLTSKIEFHADPLVSTIADYKIVSSDSSVVSIGVYKGNYFLQANKVGNATISITSLTTDNTDTASVVVTAGSPLLLPQKLEFRALGTTGTEKVNLLLNGSPVGMQHTLTTNFGVYQDTVFGAGEISVEFVNDDNVTNGRDVRLDYIAINGVKRETENMSINSAAYLNGVCGGGGFTEWLNCSGAVNFGYVDQAHKITVRARGNAGGEHIVVLLNGQPVNGGWTLSTAHKEYSVTVNGDGDINVKYDNNSGSKDAVVDWLKVDNQIPRQAENMQYNTAYFANGKCGGGAKSEWMHCNGVIGFGKISDNFN